MDFGYEWLNLGSLVLGFAAWLLPAVKLTMVCHRKADPGNWSRYTVISMAACAAALCLQIFYTGHLVAINDWSALMDTYTAVIFASLTLLAGTFGLNIHLFRICR